jgi:hypothetical protein
VGSLGTVESDSNQDTSTNGSNESEGPLIWRLAEHRRMSHMEAGRSRRKMSACKQSRAKCAQSKVVDKVSDTTIC